MNKFFSKLAFSFGLLVMLAIVGTSAKADPVVVAGGIVPVASTVEQPAGWGTVNTLLIIQSKGSGTTESGSVAWNGKKDVVVINNKVVGGSNNQTYVLSSITTNAADLCLHLNINEPNGPGGSNNGPRGDITVKSLVLNAYDQNGNLVFSTSLAGPVTLREATTNGNGTGKSDYVFGLSPEAAAALQAAMNQYPNLRIGLSAQIINAQGGPEGFYFGTGCMQPTAVPEPATMMLLGTGLAGVAATLRKRRKAAKE